MPNPGDILIEKYRLGRLLGEGGMGSVYEAEHTRIGKRLAVKFLLPQFAENEEVVARFTREAEAAAAIGHRSIIDIHDIGTSKDGSLFLVMEYLEGQSLGQCLKGGGALPPQVASYVVAQTLSALDAAHDKGIVHRDLKPDNIYLVESGQALPDIKLLDFGISKMTTLGNPEDRLTRTGAIMGTPYYMAPEQARGKKDLNYLVDIYAMGVILYETLTGRVPFQGENTFALVYDILNAPIQPPRQIRPDIPEGLEHIILKAMCREEAQRYMSAADMLEALVPFLDPQAVGRVAMPQKKRKDNTAPSIATPSNYSTASNPAMVPPTAISSSGLDSAINSAPGTDMAWQKGQSGIALEPAPSRKGLYIAFTVVGILVLVGAIGGTVLALGPLGRGGSSSDTAQVATQPGPTPTPTKTVPTPVAATPPPVETPPAEASSEDAGPQEVVVTLAGLPDGARVTFNGAAVEGAEIRAPQSESNGEIRVEAEGREPYVQNVSLSESSALTVEMAEVEQPTKVAESRRGGRRNTKTRNEQPPQEQTKTKSPFATQFERGQSTPFGSRFE